MSDPPDSGGSAPGPGGGAQGAEVGATGPGGLRQRLSLHDAGNRTVLLNAGAMFSATAVSALLGAVFWLVATHEFSPNEVGIASAVVAAMTLLGYLATVGLGTLLMGELPRLKADHRALLNAALLFSGAVGLVLGLAFTGIAPWITEDFELLRNEWLPLIVFVVGVGLTGVGFVLDQALIGLMRGGLQLQRNVVFSASKLAALALVAATVVDPGATWIFSTWVAGIAVSFAVLIRFYRRGEGRLRPAFGSLGRMRGAAAEHFLFNLAIRAPDLVLPLIVVTFLSATANANFYIAWMIASFAFMVPVSLSSVLFAFGSGEPEGLAHRYRLSIGLSAGLGLVANVLLVFAAGPILGLFGSEYEDGATATLQVLTLGVFAEVIKAHYLSIARLQRTIARAMPLVVGGTLLELTGAALGAVLVDDLVWVAVGWLAALAVETLLMAPTVARFTGLLGGGDGAEPGDAVRTSAPAVKR